MNLESAYLILKIHNYFQVQQFLRSLDVGIFIDLNRYARGVIETWLTEATVPSYCSVSHDSFLNSRCFKTGSGVSPVIKKIFECNLCQGANLFISFQIQNKVNEKVTESKENDSQILFTLYRFVINKS